MTTAALPVSFILLGEQSLLIQCAEQLQAHGHEIRAIVAANRRIAQWCKHHSIPCHEDFAALQDAPASGRFDYLISVTNLRMLPGWLLERPVRMAINFHDGPLPRYAGLNAPVWALLNDEPQHGIAWHEMAAGADKGPVLVSREFPIRAGETVFGLNAQCYEAGLDAFGELLERIERNELQAREQDFSKRTYFGLTKRPPSAAVLDWRLPAAKLDRLVKALDFGPYANPVITPKIDLGSQLLVAVHSRVVPGEPSLPVGAVQGFSGDVLTIRCAEDSIEFSKVVDLAGGKVDIEAALQSASLKVASVLPALARDVENALSAAVEDLVRHEDFWRRSLARAEPVELPFGSRTAEQGLRWLSASVGSKTRDQHLALLSLLLARLSGKNDYSLACVPQALLGKPDWHGRFFARVVPFSISIAPGEGFAHLLADIEARSARLDKATSYLNDLPAREPELRGVRCEDYPVRIVFSTRIDEQTARAHTGSAALTVLIADGDSMGFLWDSARLDSADLQRLVAQLGVLAAQMIAGDGRPVSRLDVLTPEDGERLQQWLSAPQVGEMANEPAACIHRQFERQAALTPERTACIFEGQELTYAQLNAAANRLAHLLQSRGVKPGALVGVMVGRSLDMLVALYAVHKAGAAYVPLDPVYPPDRLAYMIEDARLDVVVTQRAYAAHVAPGKALVLDDAVAQMAMLPDTNLALTSMPTDLAYVIYTSGSTGKPKGVMVEHRNVANFFAGMDVRLEAEPGTWLAVTSISFDISVLELFWTLTRGFTVVLYADATRQKASRPARAQGSRRLDFGFFYWNVAKQENDHDADKYRLLLDGARYADANGFNAVWTPERHFESFGGLFPNPSVTSAALATITSKVALRAGSCVVPLHSPIRIAEEWAVVDNLSNGRVGISVAAGWAPPDFAIKPENFAKAKQVMFESTETLKRLWRGDTVTFPGPQGEVKVRTLPRPVQKELPIWVTTAGNIDTFTQAGKLGANLLTHLLGQTVDEVAAKVKAYRQAWVEAGHPGRGIVTLMLHTFVGPDAATVERVVREPLKDYLKSAMFLVKAAAWQFPTFKKMSDEQGKTLDQFFANITPEEMDALLDFAFHRYFQTSGLFGTPEHCLGMVGRVEGADVDEIACLIDFGIETEVVLRHLPFLNELRGLAQAADPETEEDHSLPTLLKRHQVTHFQCTPSMATMLASDAEARPGLQALRQMMVGGEAFPPELARNLEALVGGRVTNMYGPTETTIWSAVGDVGNGTPLPANNVSIGTPLVNQMLYVLDSCQQLLPPGISGELVIGGAGVVRGYWQRPDLTAEKFIPDPFAATAGARMYRTGDLARFLPDGRLECQGRVDHQVKIRGYRVELGEIEAVLRADPQVLESAVVLREDVPGDQRLVAYVRSVSGGEVDSEGIKAGLRKLLPEFMVPALIVTLPEMPLTPNGKIDRKSLPAPRVTETAEAGYAPPASDAEQMITEIWQRALGLSRIGTRDNFFDIGGHSLLVVQVLKDLREKVKKPVQMTDLFRYTTIESLARFLSSDAEQQSTANRGKARAEARRAAMGRGSR